MTEKREAASGTAKNGAGRSGSGKDRKRAFLDHLAATANVKAAAAAAGAGASYFYNNRRLDPDFAAGWRAAIDLAYERIEEALVARALEDVGADQFDPGAVEIELTDARRQAAADSDAKKSGLSGKVALVDVQLALTLLNRRAAIERRGRDPHARRRPTAEEVEVALNDKLDALARRVTPLGGGGGGGAE